jgi:antitoxin component YwqK of YwqJK toxin-antitoxin module
MAQSEKTYHTNGQVMLDYETIDGEIHGRFVRYFETGQIAIESYYINGQSHGPWKEWYNNGQLAEEGDYDHGKYFVKNFWNEKGEQLLINGTGKTIRKFGTTQGDIYEQYFENGNFIGEKKIAGVIYGKFTPKNEE